MDLPLLMRLKKYINSQTSTLNEDVELLKQVVITEELDSLVIAETGTASLTNSLLFPFNNSKKSIALVNKQKDTNYVVLTEPQSASGVIGEIEVSEKQVNGFKMAYTGSASTATVKYYVIGGIIP